MIPPLCFQFKLLVVSADQHQTEFRACDVTYQMNIFHVFFGKISRGQLKPYTFLFPALFIAVIAGFLIALIVSVAVKSRYKFKNPASASLYTSSNMMLMRDSQDVFLGAHTTRVKLQSSSGGGGHSGGGGGGHSGGGGGRHR